MCGGKSHGCFSSLIVEFVGMLLSMFLILVALVKMKDHGIVRDGGKEITESQHELSRRTLSQELNRHAAVILEGTAIGMSSP